MSRIVNTVTRFQEELQKFYQATEVMEVPDIETTVIGSGGHIEYRVTKTNARTYVFREETDQNGRLTDKWKIGNLWDEEELKEQIKYDKRRLKKGWRVWRSENPDIELEKDDSED